MDKKDWNLQETEINNREDVLERYPELFTEEIVEKQTYYIEKSTPQKIETFRFFLTPSGAVAVSSFKKEEIWELDTKTEYGISLLKKLDSIIQDTHSLNIKDLVKELDIIDIDFHAYYLRILPYSDAHSISVLKSILDSRYFS